MSSKDVCKSAHRNSIIVCGTLTRPRLFGQITEESKGGQTDRAEFFNMTRPGNIFGSRRSNAEVLIVARKSILKTASKPMSTKKKNPLRIVDVVEQLADRPLFRRVSMARLFFRNTG